MNYWRLRCQTCKWDYPSVIVQYFTFTHEGKLRISGICRQCSHNVVVHHTRAEIMKDILDAKLEWLKDNPEEMDFAEWEEELDDDC